MLPENVEVAAGDNSAPIDLFLNRHPVQKVIQDSVRIVVMMNCSVFKLDNIYIPGRFMRLITIKIYFRIIIIMSTGCQLQ